MSNNRPFSWKDNRTLITVLAVGSFYFLLTTIYSLLHYQEKFIYDGHVLIFDITNSEWFPYAAQREVFYLQQIIPVLCAMAGLKIKWVMIGYVLNVYLLYYLLFVIIVLVLKDAPAAILFLLVHYKGDPYNYFIMVEELLPGACMAVTLCSLIRNFSHIKYKPAGYAAAAILIFFVVRAHPLAVVCMAGVLPILFLSNREFFTENKSAVIIFGALGIFLFALKFGNLNAYDIERISEGKTIVQSFSELFHPAYFSKFFHSLFYTRKVFTVATCVLFVFLLLSKHYRALLVTLLVSVCMIVLFNTMVVPEYLGLETLVSTKYDQWSLPIRFVIFASLCFFMLAEIKEQKVYRAFLAVAVFYFYVGLSNIYEAQQISWKYIEQAHEIIDRCREEGVRKAVIDVNELDEEVPVMDVAYQDILVISSLKNPDSAIQVIYIDEAADTNMLNQLGDSLLLLGEGYSHISYDELNEQYYRLPEEPYEEVNMEEIGEDDNMKQSKE